MTSTWISRSPAQIMRLDTAIGDIAVPNYQPTGVFRIRKSVRAGGPIKSAVLQKDKIIRSETIRFLPGFMLSPEDMEELRRGNGRSIINAINQDLLACRQGSIYPKVIKYIILSYPNCLSTSGLPGDMVYSHTCRPAIDLNI